MKRLNIALLLLLLGGSAMAYEIKWGRNITINHPVNEDLYITGGTVTINAPIHGDLIVAGGTVLLNDSVTNDLLLAGGNVIINGYVSDDIRCAGGELVIKQPVGGDLVVTGGKVLIYKAAIIQGGLMVSGGNIEVSGQVNGPLKAAGGNMIFNGIAMRDVDARAEKMSLHGTIHGRSVLAAKELSVGAGAAFYDDVRYWTPGKEMDFGGRIMRGQPTFDPSLKLETGNWYFLGKGTALGVIWYVVTVFLFIIALEYLFSRTFDKAGHTISHTMFRSMLYGFIFFIGIPVVIVFLLLSIIGIPIGLLFIFTYAGLLVLATIITSLVMANWLRFRFGYAWNYWQLVFAALGIFIVLKLVTFTPFLGWLLMVLIAFIAFGAILRNIRWKRNWTVSTQ